MRSIKRIVVVIVILCALGFLTQLITALPMIHDLVWAPFVPKHDQRVGWPRYVIVLGGGGIPSPTGLIRTYHAAQVGRRFTEATFVVALPADGDPDASSVGRMRDELVLRGIPRESVLMETQGINTFEQARNSRTLLGDEALHENVLVVTSPTHLRRSLMCFRKQGFEKITGLTAISVGEEADLGGGTVVRYEFWNNLVSQIEIVREIVAIVVYRLRGWA